MGDISPEQKYSLVLLGNLFPRILNVTLLLEFFIKQESKVSFFRNPLLHICHKKVVLVAQDCLQKLNRQDVTFQDVREMVKYLIGLHSLCMKRAPETAKELGTTIRKLTIIIGELATSLEKICEGSVTDWMAIGDNVVSKTEKLKVQAIPPYNTFVPKMKKFRPLKLLGAGGVGTTYNSRRMPRIGLRQATVGLRYFVEAIIITNIVVNILARFLAEKRDNHAQRV
ncbi:hypothetical protein MRX96_012393 [Rhipicephalus microplus]